ncbi:MAG: hypothetical protein VKK62_03605 [Synechococcaceae cyanobacterium]|nr:hypothetical protein [Synechococcaceae cyanobacterium]
MAAQIPLLTLQDGHAPYKGVWSFSKTEQGNVEAMHSTFRCGDGPGCVIERWQFVAHEAATRFASHLLVHGWSVQRLHLEGEGLLYPSGRR